MEWDESTWLDSAQSRLRSSHPKNELSGKTEIQQLQTGLNR